MHKRISFSLVVFLFVLLITCSTSFAAENTSVIPGVGTLTFPSGTEILPNQLQTNAVGNTLFVNDNDIWRSINISFISIPSSSLNREMLMQNTDALESAFNTSIAKQVQKDNYRLLSNNPINKVAIYNEQLIIKNIKYLIPNGAIVRFNYYIIDGTGGLVRMTTIHTDCDSNYWTPIIAKMIADIKR